LPLPCGFRDFYDFPNSLVAANVSAFNIKSSGNNVVLEGNDGSDYEIYLYNGSSTIQLTNNN
jgi:hypothetical protein